MLFYSPTTSKREASPLTVLTRNMLMGFRKITNHPYLIEPPLDADGQLVVDERLVQVSGKLLLLEQLLHELKTRQHKVLIYSQMTSVLDILQDFCAFRRFAFCRLDGTMK